MVSGNVKKLQQTQQKWQRYSQATLSCMLERLSVDNVCVYLPWCVCVCDEQGLQQLNALGYGQPGSGLQLDLVYNPGGAFLAPAQAQLEPLYKQELKEVN